MIEKYTTIWHKQNVCTVLIFDNTAPGNRPLRLNSQSSYNNFGASRLKSSPRNRLSPRYILYSNHTDDIIVRYKEMLGRQQKHAQKKRNEDNGESTKR
jgi:hypothetical protein